MPLTSALNLHLIDTHKHDLTCPAGATKALAAFCESIGEYRRDANYIVYAYAVAVMFEDKTGMHRTIVDSPERNTVQHLTQRLRDTSSVMSHVYKLRSVDDYIGIFHFLDAHAREHHEWALPWVKTKSDRGPLVDEAVMAVRALRRDP